MQHKADNNTVLIPHLFRQEYTKMTAVLCRHFGLEHMEIAEDIASETFLKATEHWAAYGVPDNPAGWLYTVAKNKAKDYLKRHQLFETRIKNAVKPEETAPQYDFEFNDSIIADSLLSMIFAVCDPVNSPEAQVCLALQILCGFSVGEIANAFLSKTETIKKRLLRARASLRTGSFQIRLLSGEEINKRMDSVLKTLYLLFNEGYFSQSDNLLIRKDLCAEALRLALLLVENKLTNTPEANALLSLMCFQSSRLDARVDDNGEAILYEDQDKDRWDRFLIEKGNHYLLAAFPHKHISKYHLEASIAYWHTTTRPDKWEHILNLYNQLIIIEYSPVTALSRTFAYAKVYGNEKAIAEAEKLNLAESSYYHGLLGYLYTGQNPAIAISHYRKAIELSKSTQEKKTLEGKISQLAVNSL